MEQIIKTAKSIEKYPYQALWFDTEATQLEEKQPQKEVEEAKSKKANLAKIKAFYEAQDQAKLAQIREELKKF
jgi:hypothetical protein